MRICDDLRQAVLQAAIQGKLTKQLSEDGNAADLLKEIEKEKSLLIKEGKIKKEKTLPEILPDEEPFDIPENWVWCKINNIAFVTKLAGFEYTKNIAPNLSTKGIPLFKGKNVQNGKLILQFESYIPETVSNELPRSQLTRKCLLTPYVGTIGNIAIFDGSFRAHLGSNVGKIEIFNYGKVRVIEEYLLFYLRSETGLQQLSKFKKATAQESISIEAIRDVIIALPPLAEQQRIVARVEELMARIDDLEKTEIELEKLKNAFPGDMKAALLQAAMQGKLTEQLLEDGDAADLLKQIAAEKAKLIKEGKIKKEKPLPEITTDEVPFDIPDNWKWVRLRNACTDIFSGKSPIYSKIATNYRIIGQAANQQVGIDLTQIKYTNADFWNSMNERYFIRKNDVLLNTLGNGTLGRSGIIKELPYPLLTDGHLFVFRMVDTISSKFLYYYMQLKRSDIEKTANGSTNQTFLSLSNTVNWIIPVPPLAEQKRIVEKLDKLLPLCDGLVEE